jgi:hypothetical protein
LAEGHLEGFSLDSGNLAPTSTARYIGEMDGNGQIRHSKVWFTVDIRGGGEQELEREVFLSGPLAVGFRQFKVERWPTTRFYLIDFATEEDRRNASGKLPYKLTLRFVVKGEEDQADGEGRDEGELSVESITDSRGDEPRGGRRAVAVRLQTLPLDEGYWLDTGVVISG